MYEELYEKNQGLLRMMTRRYASLCALDRAVSEEDLMQAGFVALMKAAKSYDAKAGKTWVGWARWHIRMEFERTLGLRHGQFTRAHSGAVALDRPLSGDMEGMTMGELLPDVSVPAADEALLREELRNDVRAAVRRLHSYKQRTVVELCKLEGQSYRQAAARLGVSVDQAYQLFFRASANLSRDPRLRAAAGLEDRAFPAGRSGAFGRYPRRERVKH